ncbi:enoyl-CoA hydratase/isomerase family protein [Phytoactinopolyspora limicola]|uniref:enoyl-CoA hydratase/isomerase family protein n=1 Tax=Phytoactinopolyspora limicola TaxID=2715536 RepID=UPI0014084EA8|nr:enoyl-CoA hydratase-related protein [Phytoactinopolyspora limicola]
MDTVRVRRPDPNGVVEFVLDRPQAHNAISTEHARAIAAVGESLAEDTTVRAVVVSSTSEKAFCVGADLKERNSFSDDDLRRQRPVMRAAFNALLDLPVPTVAAIHGYALGGGFELALSCDLIVADDTAVVGLPEVSVGLVPGGGGTQLLARRIGWSRASDLVFTGRRVDADEAYRLGIADRLVLTGQARDVALELAATIAGNSPVGVRSAKRAMRLGLDGSLAAGLDVEDAAWRTTAFSGDRTEGIAAFNEKREPNWPGV